MGILDIFKKLGMAKSGGSSWSGDADNKPAEVDGIPVSDKEEAPAEQPAAPEPPAEEHTHSEGCC